MNFYFKINILEIFQKNSIFWQIFEKPVKPAVNRGSGQNRNRKPGVPKPAKPKTAGTGFKPFSTTLVRNTKREISHTPGQERKNLASW